MPDSQRGGARPGAGRHATWLALSLPLGIIPQLEEIARAEGVAVVDVVKEALLSFISDWQGAHGGGPRPAQARREPAP